MQTIVCPLLAQYFSEIQTIVLLLILLISCTATPRLESERGLFTAQLAEGEQLYCPTWDRVRGSPSEQLTRHRTPRRSRAQRICEVIFYSR